MRTLIVLVAILLSLWLVEAISFEFNPCPDGQTQRTENTDGAKRHYKNICGGFFGRSLTWFVSRDDNTINAYGTLVTALSTIAIAFFTFNLMRSTNRQWDVANRNFIATHRPKVIVRFVQGPFMENDGRRFVWITFANIGVLPAKIISIRADLNWRDIKGEWLIPGLMPGQFPCDGLVLASGQRHPITVTTKQPASNFAELLMQAGDGDICVAGEIKYADEVGVIRETGFFRTCSNTKHPGDFEPSENPEDEYQD